jgi:hypothetical protein
VDRRDGNSVLVGATFELGHSHSSHCELERRGGGAAIDKGFEVRR